VTDVTGGKIPIIDLVRIQYHFDQLELRAAVSEWLDTNPNSGVQSSSIEEFGSAMQCIGSGPNDE
jgi:hypothetical protein